MEIFAASLCKGDHFTRFFLANAKTSQEIFHLCFQVHFPELPSWVATEIVESVIQWFLNHFQMMMPLLNDLEQHVADFWSKMLQEDKAMSSMLALP